MISIFAWYVSTYVIYSPTSFVFGLGRWIKAPWWNPDAFRLPSDLFILQCPTTRVCAGETWYHDAPRLQSREFTTVKYLRWIWTHSHNSEKSHSCISCTLQRGFRCFCNSKTYILYVWGSHGSKKTSAQTHQLLKS